ncbi:HNH endonuclease [Geomonas nitrogeniifigens]|uniref:HNH endonuclease n=1 Tax=Geomonas diazotrophica TaxID=2843197 RepID=A0ABX8JCF3_9BACT|nr:NUMOD4 domain-containing protein [Geomonas nitrogeniifigens]QWV96100.1 HNH endonuclease [Geomonas nitrogeniifigens]
MPVDEQYMQELITEEQRMSNHKVFNKTPGWKVKRFIKGYERKYQICRNGLVFNRETGTWLKPQQHKNGYLYVCLYQEGKKKKVYLHRLVAEYFVPNPKGFDVVYHLDGDKTNNRAINIGRISKSLLQRELDPDNLPSLARSLRKPRKNTYNPDDLPPYVQRELSQETHRAMFMYSGTEKLQKALDHVEWLRGWYMKKYDKAPKHKP